MDPGISKSVVRDEELLACVGSGRPVPAELDEATGLVATLLQTLRSDLEVYRIMTLTRNQQVVSGYLFVRAHRLTEETEG